MPRRRHLVVLGASVLLLAGCGSHAHTAADPPLSPTPDLPIPHLSGETPERFVRRFVSVSNAMESQGGTLAYLRLTSACQACTAVANQISEARSSGGFFRSRGWTIHRLVTDRAGRRLAVALTVESAPTSYQESAHQPVRHLPGGLLTFRVALQRHRRGWLVTDLVELAR